MKLVGDVPQEHKDLAKELREMENFFDNTLSSIPKSERARGYVALAHDWYQMGAEEEGQKLLLKAEKVCPGYFKNEIKEHTRQHEDFAVVVQNITIQLLELMRVSK